MHGPFAPTCALAFGGQFLAFDVARSDWLRRGAASEPGAPKRESDRFV